MRMTHIPVVWSFDYEGGLFGRAEITDTEIVIRAPLGSNPADVIREMAEDGRLKAISVSVAYDVAAVPK